MTSSDRDISRRALLGGSIATMVGTMLASSDAGASPTAAGEHLAFDTETEVIVCGGGGAGLTSALFCRWQGAEVTLLEKAASVGGTTAKSAFWYWIPNNPAMQALGMKDEKADFLRLIARLTTPDSYDPQDSRFGLSPWQFAMVEGFYDSGAEAVALLDRKGALPYEHLPEAPDYWAELPEDKAKKGRVLRPKGGNAVGSDGGRVAIRNLMAAARRDGVVVKTSHRVARVIQDGSGRVIGVEASTDDGVVRIRARRAVIFASGGFTHNAALRANFLAMPVMGGCAALTNEGDIIAATSAIGVQLANMKNAWLAPIPLEKAIAKDGSMVSVFAMTGDSMIIVNKYGRRVADEKQPYNELAQLFGEWDGAKSEHPNLVLISIWDQRAQEKCASPYFGSLIVPEGTDDRHVIKGATLAELASRIGARLEALHEHVSARLAPDFTERVGENIARFNLLAAAGKDTDFGRGERSFSLFMTGPAKEPGQRNSTLWPIASKGPYYAALIVAGTLDTKGGPKTDDFARILDFDDKPILGLYGIGNCVASVSGAAYWAGGGTIGPLLTFAYRASRAIRLDNG